MESTVLALTNDTALLLGRFADVTTAQSVCPESIAIQSIDELTEHFTKAQLANAVEVSEKVTATELAAQLYNKYIGIEVPINEPTIVSGILNGVRVYHLASLTGDNKLTGESGRFKASLAIYPEEYPRMSIDIKQARSFIGGYDFPDAYFNTTQINAVLNVATEIDFAAYPKPVSFIGDDILGAVMGVRP